MKCSVIRPRGHKTFSMLNSNKHGIFPAHQQLLAFLTFMSGKNNILDLSEPKKAEFLDILYTYEHFKVHAQLS